MAFQKRFKSDPIFVDNFNDFMNALFNGETACELLKTDVTKLQIIQFFAGTDYTSLSDFNRSLKSKSKKTSSKEKKTHFLVLNDLKMYAHSSYAIFLEEEKNEYKKKNIDLPLKELRLLMANDWNEMSSDNPIKVKYNKIHQDSKNKFLEKVKEIDPSSVKLFEKEKSTSPPRRYNIFVTEQMRINREENNGLNGKDVMKLAGEKWKALTEEEKEKYSTLPTTEEPEKEVKSKTAKFEPVKEVKEVKGKTSKSEPVKEVKEVKSKTSKSEPVKEVKEVKGKTSKSQPAELTKPEPVKETNTLDEIMDDEDITDEDITDDDDDDE